MVLECVVSGLGGVRKRLGDRVLYGVELFVKTVDVYFEFLAEAVHFLRDSGVINCLRSVNSSSLVIATFSMRRVCNGFNPESRQRSMSASRVFRDSGDTGVVKCDFKKVGDFAEPSND